MRRMFVLVALFGLAACPAIAAITGEKGALEPAMGQKQGYEKRVSTQSQEPSMVLVPAGEFTMGSATGDPDERPAHQVYLDAFYIDRYEVSVGDFAAFLRQTRKTAPFVSNTMNEPARGKK